MGSLVTDNRLSTGSKRSIEVMASEFRFTRRQGTAGSVAAERIQSEVASLPECGVSEPIDLQERQRRLAYRLLEQRTCFSNAFGLQRVLDSCSGADDTTCFCGKDAFKNSIRDCANESCPSADRGQVIDLLNQTCGGMVYEHVLEWNK